MSVLMTMMTTLMETSQRETRDLVTTLVLGREPPPPTTPLVTTPTPNGKVDAWDYDSTPLPPGVEGVLQREVSETEQARLLRERGDLQARADELIREWEALQVDDSTAYSPRHLAPEPPAPSPG
jgi:hypothetical protein